MRIAIWRSGVGAASLMLMACSPSSGTGNTASGIDAPAGKAAPATLPVNAAAQAQPSSVDLPLAARDAWIKGQRAYCIVIKGHYNPNAKLRFAPNVDSGTDAAGAEMDQFGTGVNPYITADLNGDGRRDFIITRNDTGCESDDDDETGNMPAGPENDFVLSTSTGGYRMFDGFLSWLSPAMIKRRGHRDVLVNSGGWNGNCGAIADAVWGWDGSTITVIERHGEHGEPVDEEGCAVASPPNKPDGFPISAGKYAVDKSCREAAAAGDYDRITRHYWSEIDGDTPLGPIRKLGSSRWSLGSGLVIEVTGAKTFTEGGRTMTWCSS